MGLVPLTTYQQLLTTVADHMLQLGTIATQLIVARTATQAAEAGYAQAVENQQRAGQAYVNAYFDTAYQTPMPLQGQPFTMDLNSTYGARLSPSERVHVEEHRQTSRERALAFAGSNPLDGVERLSADHPVNQQPQRYRSTIALNRRGYLSDIHELVPLSYEFAIVLQSQDELRQAVLSEHRSMINFARAFMLALRYSPSVTPQRREAEETNAAMVYAWERRANVRAEESRLQAAQVQMTASMGRLLDLLEGGNFMTFQQLREDSRRQEQPSFVPAPRSMGMSAPAA
jgi:sulfur relay (sulfurtransferase) DsrC/TusE family protein